MMTEEEITAWIAQRDAALRAATPEAARKMWMQTGQPLPEDETVPLAGLHKARIMWRDATAEEVKQSQVWLREHGYKAPPRPTDFIYPN